MIAQSLLLAGVAIAAPLAPGARPKAVSASIGSAAFLYAAWTGLSGVFQLGSNRTSRPAPRDGGTLVTHGVYAVIRHPLYAAMMAMGVGWACFWSSGIALVIAAMLPQVMPPMDAEMVTPVHDYLTERGIVLALGAAVAGFAEKDGHLEVLTKDGPAHPADIVILAIGVRPETTLAKAAGLTLGGRGGIRVDEQMRGSDPDIWAVGDAVEVRDRITGAWTLLALAGPANRQGRVAADAICGRDVAFHGTQGTAVCGIFDLAVASTGASEKVLQSAQLADHDLSDVRDPDEFSAGHAPGARSVPLNALRGSPGNLSKDRPLAVCCAAGGRAHNAVRLLRQHGFNAANLSGGYSTFLHVNPARNQ